MANSTQQTGTGEGRGVASLPGASTWLGVGMGAAERAVGNITTRYAPEGGAASSSVSLRALGFADRLVAPRLMSTRFAERAVTGPSRMGVNAPASVYPFPWFADDLAKMESARVMLGRQPTLVRPRAATTPVAVAMAASPAMMVMAPQVVPTQEMAWVDLSGYQAQAQAAAPRAFPQAAQAIAPLPAPTFPAATPVQQMMQARAAQQAYVAAVEAQARAADQARLGSPTQQQAAFAPGLPAAPGFALRSEYDPAPLATAILAASASGGTVFAPYVSPMMVQSALGMALAAGASVVGADAEAPTRSRSYAVRAAEQERVVLAVSDSMLRPQAQPAARPAAAAPSAQARAVNAQIQQAQRAQEVIAQAQAGALAASVAPAAVSSAVATPVPAFAPAGMVAGLAPSMIDLASALAPPATLPAMTMAAALTSAAAPQGFALPAGATTVRQAALAPVFQAAYALPAMVPLAAPVAQASRAEAFAAAVARTLVLPQAEGAPAPTAAPMRASAFEQVAARFEPAYVSVGPEPAAPVAAPRALPTRPVATPSLGAQLAPLASLLSVRPEQVAAQAAVLAAPAPMLPQAPLPVTQPAPMAAAQLSMLAAQLSAPAAFSAAAMSFLPALEERASALPLGASANLTASFALPPLLVPAAAAPQLAAEAPFAAMALPVTGPLFARSIGHADWVDNQMARRSPQEPARSAELRMAAIAPEPIQLAAIWGDSPAAPRVSLPSPARITTTPVFTPAMLAARDASSVLAGGRPLEAPALRAAPEMTVLQAPAPQAPVAAPRALPVVTARPALAPTALAPVGFQAALAASPVPAAVSGGHAPAWAQSEIIASLAGVAALRDTLPVSVLERGIWAPPPALAASEAAAPMVAGRAPERVPLAVADDMPAPAQAARPAEVARARAQQAHAQAQAQVQVAHAQAIAAAHADFISQQPAAETAAGPVDVARSAPWAFLPPAAAATDSMRPGAFAARAESLANRTVARSADLALDIVDPALLAEGRALGLTPAESVAALRLAAGGPVALRAGDFAFSYVSVGPDGAPEPAPARASSRVFAQTAAVQLAERAAQVPSGVPASFLPGLATATQAAQAALAPAGFAAQAAGGGEISFQYVTAPDGTQVPVSASPAARMPPMTLLRGSTTWPRAAESPRASGPTHSVTPVTDMPALGWLQFTAALAGQVEGTAVALQAAFAATSPNVALAAAAAAAQPPVETGEGTPEQVMLATAFGDGEIGHPGAAPQLRATQREQARAQLSVLPAPAAAGFTPSVATATTVQHGRARSAPEVAYAASLQVPPRDVLQLQTGSLGHSAPAPLPQSRPAQAAPELETIRPAQSALSREEVVRAVSQAVGGNLPGWLADAAAKQQGQGPVDQFTALDLAFVQTAAPRAVPLAARPAAEAPPGRGQPSGAPNKKQDKSEDLELLARQIYDEILRMMELQRERTGGH